MRPALPLGPGLSSRTFWAVQYHGHEPHVTGRECLSGAAEDMKLLIIYCLMNSSVNSHLWLPATTRGDLSPEQSRIR